MSKGPDAQASTVSLSSARARVPLCDATMEHRAAFETVEDGRKVNAFTGSSVMPCASRLAETRRSTPASVGRRGETLGG